ncbi:phosphatidylserine decarboxylase [Bacillus sp. S/N-304-OC-R1]|uniref:phosphatidylserine decarboxylase n=1 Tax=Bacillus sp. S/N-304-OC-R1 TaxID=2758034 RepID=UPI001C8DB4AC|nr:phosphatidylserine decarboxylase [Bacillus sp. S/N-304-OC-R1]MBY0123870.1 phosphatidylserine decarboxylase [Bacillus sp. S/N-304-OC-R1]
MKQTIYRLLIELTNGKITSSLLKRFARSKASKNFVSSFCNAYHINQDEMEKKLEEYPTLHEFFTRSLKKGMRIIDQDAQAATSPVDAVIEDIGKIQPGHIITVKGKNYSISEMLGKNEKLDKYTDGYYMIFYLSPSHYHRIHSPVTGHVIDQWILGTKSYPVNKYGLKYGKSALSKNYRIITEVEHECGTLSIVKVGAMFVNSIEVIHEGDRLIKGDEMAYFSFGSTVVLLFEKNSFSPLSTIKTPYDIKVGERIGFFKQMK